MRNGRLRGSYAASHAEAQTTKKLIVFTGWRFSAYIPEEGERWVMGLPALQQFAHLTSAVEARSNEAVRAGEVISFSFGSTIVAFVRETLAAQSTLRDMMIEGQLLLAQMTDEELSRQSISDTAKLRALLRRFSRIISRPMLARPTGFSLVSLAEKLEKADFPKLGDRRLALRQAHRVRDGAHLCEQQRVRLHKLVVESLSRLDMLAHDSEQATAHEEAYMAELIATTKDRHPVINAYLAR